MINKINRAALLVSAASTVHAARSHDLLVHLNGTQPSLAVLTTPVISCYDESKCLLRKVVWRQKCHTHNVSKPGQIKTKLYAYVLPLEMRAKMSLFCDLGEQNNKGCNVL